MKTTLPCAVLAWCLLSSGRSGGEQLLAGELRAGAAKVDITPTQPVQMAGYQSRKDLSQGIHDPLGARVVAFEQDQQHLVLVSVDNLGLYNGTAEPLRKAIIDECHLRPTELFLCAIHTHSAPTLGLDAQKVHTNNVAYTQQLRENLVAVVRRALQQLTPVRIGIGSGSSPVGVNRREVVQTKEGPPKTVLGRNTSLLTDREVQVLELVGGDRPEPMAVLFAYATHSTSLGPRNYFISGDIHGLAEQFLENFFRGGLVAPGFAGASGNIDPWVRVLPEFRTNNGWMPEPVLLGTLLGEEVARVTEGIRGFSTNTIIQTASKTLALPGKNRGNPENSGNPTTPFNVTVGRLGEVAFVGLGGEVFNELGRAIKSTSPFPHTFVFTHCNGSAGYVPIRSSYTEGGYEVETSGFAPGAGEQLVEETGRMLQQLKAGAK